MKNYVISGARHVGKTTMAKKIIANTSKNVYGFMTFKSPEEQESRLYPVYIGPATAEPKFSEENLVGMCGGKQHYCNIDVFDNLGVELLTTTDPNGLIIMDELGFLESDAKLFQAKVFECLAGEIPTIAFIKKRMQIEFMQKLRDFPGIEYVELSEENRDEIYEKIMKDLML